MLPPNLSSTYTKYGTYLYLNSLRTRSGVPWMKRITWQRLSTFCCPGTSTPVSSWSPSSPEISSPCFLYSLDSGPPLAISGPQFYRFIIMAKFTGSKSFFNLGEKIDYNIETGFHVRGGGGGGGVMIKLFQWKWQFFWFLTCKIFFFLIQGCRKVLKQPAAKDEVSSHNLCL